MIDTVILQIPQGKYLILKPERFQPNAEALKQPGNYLIKYVNNPTAQDKRTKHYRPRLTLMKRMTKNGQTEQPLKIEFSIPKLLYGNNLDETAEVEFPELIKKLATELREIGVGVLSELLINAKVSAVHYSKNLELPYPYTCSSVLKDLAKVNVPKRLDLTPIKFTNGEALQYSTASHSLVFYDKIQDLTKPDKRATDKHQNYVQRSLFEPLSDSHLEILRMEVRLSKKQKLNSLFGKLGFPINPTLRDVIQNKTAKTVIEHYWREFVAEHNLFIFDTHTSPHQILQDILASEPKIKPKQAIYLTGLKTLAQDEAGIRKLRQALSPKSSDRTWMRLAKGLRTLNRSPTQYHDWVKQIITQIDEFKPYKHEVDM